jgi:hypothetical protein
MVDSLKGFGKNVEMKTQCGLVVGAAVGGVPVGTQFFLLNFGGNLTLL